MKQLHLKTALVAINAQYVHTGLGARSIAAYLHRETDFAVDLLEFTINQPAHTVLEHLYQSQADVFLFSCYLWNIDMVLQLARDLRQLLPCARIGLGGPQVGYKGEAYLAAWPEIDWIVTGEGEETVCHLLRLLAEGRPLAQCPGLLYRQGESIAATPPRPPIPLDCLAFAYPDLAALSNRIIYYESIRGCPFACSYCTSSIERGVRKRSLSLVFADLAVFLEHMVPQVKFVDRTFNCDKRHSRAIWEWLAAHDNGITNFHFELAGELLDEDTLAFLATVRPGLFQFEVGVQSTNPATLAEIDRPANLPLLFARIRQLLAPGNIHVHLDLIAGLPYEDFECFQASFNAVYACQPHQFQLGFLKVLPGSKMEAMAKSYGLLYSKSAPFEALSTRWLAYPQLQTLHGVAEMVNLYYNSFRFSHIIALLASRFPNPFAFYLALWEHYRQEAEGRPVSEMGHYSLLESFAQGQGMPITEEMQWLTKYDLLLQKKPRKLPAWISVDLSRAYRSRIQGFFMAPENIAEYLPEYEGEPSLRIERTAHLEIFPFHPETGAAGPVAVLFNYKRRTVSGLTQVHTLPAGAIDLH